MNRGIYTVATGMLASQRAMDTVANNLANATTQGFKKDGLRFGDLLTREMAADGGEGRSIGSLGSGATVRGGFTDFGQGSLTVTHNPLDVALEGEGMFAVRLPNGDVRYTRDGAFALRADGTLVTKLGHPVLGPDLQPVDLGTAGSPRIGRDGAISLEGSPREVGRIGVFAGAFEKEASNLYRGRATAIDPREAASATVRQGAIEGSNVNAVTEMIELIKIQRVFELAQKSAQTQDDMSGKLMGALG